MLYTFKLIKTVVVTFEQGGIENIECPKTE